MTIIATNPGSENALSTITHIAPASLTQAPVLEAIEATLKKTAVIKDGVAVIAVYSHLRVTINMATLEVSVDGEWNTAQDVLAVVKEKVDAAVKLAESGGFVPTSAAPAIAATPTYDPALCCLECGATYAHAGFVEQGGMGCRRCG